MGIKVNKKIMIIINKGLMADLYLMGLSEGQMKEVILTTCDYFEHVKRIWKRKTTGYRYFR